MLFRNNKCIWSRKGWWPLFRFLSFWHYNISWHHQLLKTFCTIIDSNKSLLRSFPSQLYNGLLQYFTDLNLAIHLNQYNIHKFGRIAGLSGLKKGWFWLYFQIIKGHIIWLFRNKDYKFCIYLCALSSKKFKPLKVYFDTLIPYWRLGNPWQ